MIKVANLVYFFSKNKSFSIWNNVLLVFLTFFMIVCTKNSSKSLAIMAIKALKGETFSTQGGHEQTTTMRIRVFTLAKFSMQ